LVEPKGENPNPFYLIPQAPGHLVHTSHVDQKYAVQKVYEYDVQIEEGESVIVRLKE
jgi:hypothetical protein